MAIQLYQAFNVNCISDGASTTVQINLRDQPISVGPASLNSFDLARNLPTGIGPIVANGQPAASASLSGAILTVTVASVPANGVDFSIGGQLIF